MTGFFATYLLLAALAAQGTYTVDEVTISTRGDSTYVLVVTSGPADFKKFRIDNPPRIGVDLFGGVFNLPKGEYTRMPPGVVAALRGSQYEPAPNPVARIVLDLVEMPKGYSVRKHPEGVMLALYTPDYPAIGKWSSGRLAAAETVAAKVETVAAPKETVAAVETVAAKAETALVEVRAKEEIPPELAVYLRPETLVYKGVTADNETLEVAKYIRNMVVYKPKGPDPFIVPERTKKVPLGKEPLPVVDNLTLVGIVKSGDSRLAILQDNTGFGYILGKGDPVENGVCVEVTDTSAKFDILEFGQIRKIELPLVKPKKGQQ